MAFAIILVVLAQAAAFAPADVRGAATSFVDAFDRPDASVPGNGWQEAQGDLLVSGNELRNVAGVPDNALAIQPFDATDQSASARFASTGNNSIPELGLVLRFESAQRYYVLYRLAGATSQLRIAKVINGQETVLAQASVSNPTENARFTLSASAVGTSLSLAFGTKTITATDSAIVAGGFGLVLGTRTTNPALRVSHRADDFNATK